MRLKALAEIYTMLSFAQLCNLIFFVKILPKFLQKFANSAKLAKFLKMFAKVGKILANLEKMRS